MVWKHKSEERTWIRASLFAHRWEIDTPTSTKSILYAWNMDDSHSIAEINEAQDWDYSTLYYSFWPLEEYRDGPVIAAAGLADTEKLLLLLDRADLLEEDDYTFCAVDQPHDFKSMTTLLRAVERKRPENVQLLLDHGANPDGVPISRQKDLARRFRRFCSTSRAALYDMEVGVSDESVGTVPSQTNPNYLTEDELVERRTSIAPFWAVPRCFEIDYSMEEALYHSVVMAGLSTPDILDKLLGAGADTSAWRNPGTTVPPNEEDLQPSQLSISTPLHAAIATKNLTMLHALLDRGLSPDARAVVTGSQALTPMQYAIVVGDIEAYTLLKARGADPDIRTPVFNVHTLHFAASLLRLDLLEAIGLPLSSASTTAMGDTLLHIITLPYNNSELQSFAPKVSESIHDIRGMQASHRICERNTKHFDAEGESKSILDPGFQTSLRGVVPHDRQHQNPRTWDRDPAKHFTEQDAICKVLIKELGASQIGLPDKHGNTMLHYLASGRAPNESLINWLKLQETGVSVWQCAANYWGHTPQDLYEDGESARARAQSGVTVVY